MHAETARIPAAWGGFVDAMTDSKVIVAESVRWIEESTRLPKRIYGATNEIMKTIIARDLTGLWA